MMDYKRHYEQLIKTRRGRELDENVYYEKHHIIPTCIGGTNRKENIIHLTAREHYVAHWLLYRARQHSAGLAYSFWKMTFDGGRYTKREYTISSRAYEEAKTAMAEANRIRVTGRKIEEKHLVKWRRNKNNSKSISNVKTNEVFASGKAVWAKYYKDIMSYSNFNSYLRGKVKGTCSEMPGYEGILDWKYNEETDAVS